jgi:hypothetical protein
LQISIGQLMSGLERVEALSDGLLPHRSVRDPLPADRVSFFPAIQRTRDPKAAGRLTPVSEEVRSTFQQHSRDRLRRGRAQCLRSG